MDRRLRDDIAAVEEVHWWYAGRRRIVDSVLERLRLRPGSTLLEIGCGGGANLRMASRHAEVFACEPDAEDRERATAQGIGTITDGALPNRIPFGDRTFDVILLLDVLEHVSDDRASASVLYDRLHAGGRLVMTVPAHPWLWSAHDEANHHHRRYRRAELVSLLEAAGFIVERSAWFNSALFPIVALQRSIGRIIGLDQRGVGLPPPVVNQMLGAILAFERHGLGRLPFGVSLLVVARRD